MALTDTDDVPTNVTATTWTLGHRPALDGVRGIAFAMVLLGHSGWPRANRAHEFGVELFFVLSGLLITGVLLSERSLTGAIDLRRFYSRRARRLVPALVAMLLVLVATIPFGLDRWRPTSGGLIGGLTYSTNILKGNRVPLGNLGHLWSLAVEEHFYLVWPVLLIIAAGRGALRVRIVVALIVALITVSFLWRWGLVLHGEGDRSPRFYSATDLRVVSPLVGSLLAVVLMQLRPSFRGRHHVWLLTVLGIAAVIALSWVSTGPPITYSDAYWIKALPLATIASVAGCVAALAPGGPLVWLLSWPWLRWLGRCSYAGYLWHYPVFLGVGGHFTRMTGWQTLWGVAITLVLASLSGRFVERRWRQPRPAQLATPAVLAIND